MADYGVSTADWEGMDTDSKARLVAHRRIRKLVELHEADAVHEHVKRQQRRNPG